MFAIRLLSIVLVLVLSGCPAASPPAGSTAESGSATVTNEPVAAMETDVEIPVEEPGDVTSTKGRWLMSVMLPQVIMPGLVIDLASGETPAIVATSPFTPNWEVVDGVVGETDLKITFKNSEGQPVVVTAKLDNNAALRGNAAFGPGQSNYIEFKPTELSEFADDVKQQPTDGIRVLQAKMAANEPFERGEAMSLVAKLGTSPTSAMLYQAILQDGLMTNAPIDQLLADADAMVTAEQPWGQVKLVAAYRRALSFLLSRKDLPLEDLKKWIERTEEAAGEEFSASTVDVLEVAKASAALRDESLSIEEVKTAVQAVQNRNPFDPMTYQFRFQLAEREDDPEAKLRVAAEQIALPIGEGSVEPVKELYKTVHGNEDGFDGYLENLYDELLISFAASPGDAAVELGETPVLIELFTGGSCPPCVAADVAIEGVEKTFPDNAIVIRYHMDIPRPDPLATATGQARYDAYQQLPGTPSVVVNGIPRQIPGLAGPYQLASMGYQNLSQLLVAMSKVEVPAKVKSVAAVADDVVRVVARAEGIPEGKRANLVVVLAARSLDLNMPNGIRHHGMVVRALPAGVVGVGKDASDSAADSDAEESPDEKAAADEAANKTADDAEKEDDKPAEEEGSKESDAKADSQSFDIVTETNLKELQEKLIASLNVSADVVEENRETITNLSDLVAVTFLQDSMTGEVLAVHRTDVKKVQAFPEAPATEGESSEKPKEKPAQEKSESEEKPASAEAEKPKAESPKLAEPAPESAKAESDESAEADADKPEPKSEE